jgi:YD repeat-containing protein
MSELDLYPEQPDYLIDPVEKVEYSYDAAGNRTKMTSDGETTRYNYDKANRLTQAGEDLLIYDENGNLIEKTTTAGTVKYEYTGDNLLNGVYYPDETSVEYTYDAFRRKVSRTQTFYDLKGFDQGGKGQVVEVQEAVIVNEADLHEGRS